MVFPVKTVLLVFLVKMASQVPEVKLVTLEFPVTLVKMAETVFPVNEVHQATKVIKVYVENPDLQVESASLVCQVTLDDLDQLVKMVALENKA